MKLLFKETHKGCPLALEEHRLSIEHSGGTWFGCLTDSADRLVGDAFGSDSRLVHDFLKNYSKRIGGRSVDKRHPLTREMIRIFDGNAVPKPTSFNTQHVSNFQRQVYQVLEQIPIGKVTTYGLIAKRLGSAPRAVGGAVSSNPWPLFIPCQRVVNFDLTIGNYGLCGSLSQTGTITKRGLLERENVSIVHDRIDQSSVWDPSRKKS